MTFHELDRSERLDLCQRGTDLFAARLADLGDDELDGDTLLSGWNRRHLVGHVAHNAEALNRLLQWARTGVETPMYASPEQRRDEIAKSGGDSATTLRKRFSHTAQQLGNGWSTLTDDAWSAQVRTAQGRMVSASETVWMRTREVWIHAVDLGTGARFDDVPGVVLASLLDDIVATWRRKALGSELVIEVVGAAPIVVGADAHPRGARVSGTLPDVVTWAAGRATAQVTEIVGMPPPWL